MADYTFTKDSTDLSSNEIWTKTNQSLKNGKVINSISNIPYSITDISTTSISYTGEDRSNGEPELISKECFIKVVEGLKKLGTFNSNQSKSIFQQTKIYRKRSPMFAILLTTSLIEKK